jgi:hypothetical protein
LKSNSEACPAHHYEITAVTTGTCFIQKIYAPSSSLHIFFESDKLLEEVKGNSELAI